MPSLHARRNISRKDLACEVHTGPLFPVSGRENHTLYDHIKPPILEDAFVE